MCGRYSLTTPVEALRALFGFDELPNLEPRYNIAPTQGVVAVRIAASGAKRELTAFRWGLVPSWAKDVAIGSRMINARAETVAEKPAYRNAFKRRRCLIPADGFYEWKKAPDGGKQPWRIALEGDAPFAFAGLWEQWMAPEGSEVESCTIVTTDAAPDIAPIHHRMPVILDPVAYDTWLAGEPQEAQALLHPYGGKLRAYRVSRQVNNVRNDDSSLFDPAPESDETVAEQLDLL